MVKDFLKVLILYTISISFIWAVVLYFILSAIEESPINTNKYLLCEDNSSKVASQYYGLGTDKVLLYINNDVLEFKKEDCKFIEGE